MSAATILISKYWIIKCLLKHKSDHFDNYKSNTQHEPFWSAHHEFLKFVCIYQLTGLKYSPFVWFLHPLICIEKQKSS